MQIIKRLAFFTVLAICFLGISLSGCSQTEEPSVQGSDKEDSSGAGLKLELRIGFDGVASGNSRGDDPVTTYGDVEENIINTLTIFLYKSGTYICSETLNPSNCSKLPFTAESESHWLQVVQEFTNINYGSYTVYVAANLSTDQIKAFQTDIDANFTYYSLPGLHLMIGEDFASPSEGLAMTCKEPKTLEYSESKKVGTCQFNMQRVAAKLLVTAKTDVNKTRAIVDAKENGKDKFMIWLKDISFTVNTVNRSTYLFQHADAKDTNDMGKDDDLGVDNLFVYNPIYSWSNFSVYFKKVQPHDDSLFPYDNMYGQSKIYVPENTFSVPAELEGINPEKQVTHVIIRAKIIPLALKVPKGLKKFAEEEGYSDLEAYIKPYEDSCPDDQDIYTIYCNTEKMSNNICKLALMYENFEGDVSSSTFFIDVTDSNKDLYTYSAAKMKAQGAAYQRKLNNTLQLDNFRVYNNGYANYTVYISDNDTDGTYEWRKSQILRNTYYILCIKNFGSPGEGLNPNEKYIEVHTKIIEYKDSWKGEIELE